MRLRAASTTVLALAACRGAEAPPPRAEPRARAPAAPADEALIAELRAALREGRAAQVLARTERLLAGRPWWVPLRRLRQDAQLALGLAGEAWAEILPSASGAEPRPEALYLRSRLLTRLAAKRRFLRRARAAFPGDPWLRYAAGWLAIQERRYTRARTLLAPLLDVLPDRPEVPLLLFRARNWGAPHPRLAAWRARRDRLGVPSLWDLVVVLAGGRRTEDFLAALRGAPRQPELPLFLSASELAPPVRRLLIYAVAADPGLLDDLLAGPNAFLPVDWALLEGRFELATAWALRSVGRIRGPGGRSYKGRHESRLHRATRLLAGAGRLREALALWRRVVRPEDFLGPGLLGGAAARLLAAGPISRREPTTPVQAAADLDVLLRAGWVAEVLALAPRFRRRWPGSEALAALEHEAAAFLRFEAALVEAAGRGGASGEPPPAGLDGLLERLRALSQRVLGRDVVGRPRFLRFPFLGDVLDPFGPGLPAYFRRFGRHLLLGWFAGRDRPSLLLGRLLAERRVEAPPELPLAGVCREVVLEEKLYADPGDGFGASLGLALWNHYVLDLERIGEAEAFLEGPEAEADLGRAERLLGQPFPLVGVLDLDHGAQVYRRLRLLALRARPGRAARRKALLAHLRLHEQAHLSDSHHLLPLAWNPIPALRLLLDSGLSRANLLANLEARAECAALAFGSEPRLVLAEMASFAAEDAIPDPREPHGRGYRRILRALIARWAADGAPGAERPDANLYAQLHLLAPERARSYARAILAAEPGWRRAPAGRGFSGPRAAGGGP